MVNKNIKVSVKEGEPVAKFEEVLKVTAQTCILATNFLAEKMDMNLSQGEIEDISSELYEYIGDKVELSVFEFKVD